MTNEKYEAYIRKCEAFRGKKFSDEERESIIKSLMDAEESDNNNPLLDDNNSDGLITGVQTNSEPVLVLRIAKNRYKANDDSMDKLMIKDVKDDDDFPDYINRFAQDISSILGVPKEYLPDLKETKEAEGEEK